MTCTNAPRLSPKATPKEIEYWNIILPEGKKCNWKIHEVLISPGSTSSGLHFCLSGAYTAIAYGKAGQQRCLWRMEPYSIIGEIAMFANDRAIFNMECQENGETVFFEKELLLYKLLPKHPYIGQSIMRLLALKLRMQSADVVACTFIPAKIRVAIFLLQIFRDFGNPIPFSHNELADYLGLHRVTVTNALSWLRNQAFVDTIQREMIILNPAGLEKYIQEGYGCF